MTPARPLRAALLRLVPVAGDEARGEQLALLEGL